MSQPERAPGNTQTPATRLAEEVTDTDPELPCPNDGCDFQCFTAPSIFGVREKVTECRYSEYETECRHFIRRYRPAHDNFAAFLNAVESHPDVVVVGDHEGAESPAEVPLAAYHISPTIDTETEGGSA